MQKTSANPKERIVNFRSFFVIALFLIATVFSALITLNSIILGTIFILLLITFAGALCYKNRKTTFKKLTYIICLISMSICFFMFIFTVLHWNNKALDAQDVAVSGMIQSDVSLDGQRKIYLTRLTLNGESARGNILIYCYDNHDTLEVGTLISMTMNLQAVKLVDGLNTYASYFRNNTRYTAQLKGEAISNAITGEGRVDPITKLKVLIHKKLALAMGDQYGALAFGMLTGDKAYIDLESINYFSVAGILHILAVSGLHLNIVAAMLMWFLKRLGMGRIAIAITTAICVFSYVLLAGFSPSVTRAFIMLLITLFVFVTGVQYDMLNSLSFAFCVLIVFTPLFLFETGFILSFSCVFGIALFSRTFQSALQKIKIPQKIASGLALCLAIQVGVLPATLYIFNSFHPYGILVNVILMPLMTVIFGAIFLMLLLALIIPPLLFPLTLAGLGIGFLDVCVNAVARLPHSTIILYVPPFIFACYVLYFLMSRFIMLKYKGLAVAMCVVLCMLLTLVQNPARLETYSIKPIEQKYNCLSFVKTQQGNYVVGDFFNVYGVQNSLKSINVYSIDGLYVNTMNDSIALQIAKLAYFFGSFDLYFPLDNYSGGIESLSRLNVIAFEAEQFFESGFCALYQDGRFYAYGLESADIRIFFAPDSYNYSYFDRLNEFDIIRANQYYNCGDYVYLLNRGLYYSSKIMSNDRIDEYIFNYVEGKYYGI